MNTTCSDLELEYELIKESKNIYKISKEVEELDNLFKTFNEKNSVNLKYFRDVDKFLRNKLILSLLK